MDIKYSDKYNKSIGISLIYIITTIFVILNCLFFKINTNLFTSFKDLFSKKNYVVNGDFSNGLKGWRHDKVEIKNIDGVNKACFNVIGNNRIRINQSINTISGKVYRLEFTLNGPSRGAYAGYRDEKLKNEEYCFCNGINTNKTYIWTFIPKSSGIKTLFLSAGKEGYYNFSNVSLSLVVDRKVVIFNFIISIIVILLLLVVTYYFYIKFYGYFYHYLICLIFSLIALFNFHLLLLIVFLSTILLYFTLNQKLFYIFPLILITFWGFLKRFLYLGNKCFWWDEFLTEQRVWFSSSHLFDHPMTARCLFYSFFLKYYSSVIRFFYHNNFLTEFQLRLPHCIIGTLSIVIVYLIGKNYKDKVTGLFMALFAATSSFLIYYAREARFYPFVLFFSACLVHAVILILLRDKNIEYKKLLVYYGYYSLVAICGMHTHQGFWLLFIASNIYLAIFELYNVIFNSNNKTKSFLKIIPIFILLFLPIATSFSSIFALLNQGSNSGIIVAQKLVPRLDNNFFVKVHNELWNGVRYRSYMHYVIFSLCIFLLLYKSSRKLALYFIMIIIITFASLRNMGTFREPFRVKYITFMWLIEMLVISISIINVSDFLTSFIKKNKIKQLSKCLFLSFAFILSQKDLYKTFKLPHNNSNERSFRTVASFLSQNINKNDLILTYGAGLTALSYYNRFYASDWNIQNIERAKGNILGNIIFNGFLYCFFDNNDFDNYNKQLFDNVSSGQGFNLFKSKKALDCSLQNNINVAIIDGFTKLNKRIDITHYDKLFFKDNFLNDLDKWDFSFKNKYVFSDIMYTNSEKHFVVSNCFSKTLVISKSLSLTTNGLYAFTYKTSGFNNGGHISISNNKFNKNFYSADLKSSKYVKYYNMNIDNSQKVIIKILIRPDGYADLSNIGFYKLEINK